VSPKPGGWAIYSTSFIGNEFRQLTSLCNDRRSVMKRTDPVRFIAYDTCWSWMVMVIRRQVSELMLKTIALLLAVCFGLTACQLKITHVNVYPAFGPHYGDGGGG